MCGEVPGNKCSFGSLQRMGANYLLVLQVAHYYSIPHVDTAIFAGCSRLPLEDIKNLRLPWIQEKETADWSLMSL